MRVSQSEADSFLTCARKHYYAHGESGTGLMPQSVSQPLSRGTVGHSILEEYFTHRKQNKSHQDCVAAAMAKTMGFLSGEVQEEYVDGVTAATELIEIFSRGNFWEWLWTNTQHWDILEIEEKYLVQVDDDLEFAMRLDLLVRDRQKNKVYLVDHKFIYNFYDPNLVAVLPQMAKYVAALRHNGISVDDGIYLMVRTRSLKEPGPDNRFQLMPANLKDSKINAYWSEQVAAMKRIKAIKDIDRTQWREQWALRTANQFTCNICPFIDLCTLDLNGGAKRDLMIKSFYAPNSYGYEDEA